jgi:Do/DeqQ family serine protease
MKSTFQIRRTTAVLVLVIAALAGALIYKTSTPTAPLLTTAQAASTSEAPFYSFAPVVKKVMPAVVNISSSRTVKTSAGGPGGFFDDPFFRQFFGGRVPQMPRERKAQSLGSGVVVSRDGYILTNNHVVEGATDVKVAFSDKREFPAKIVGRDSAYDLAVVKIDAKDLPTLPLSDAEHNPQVGDVALAIGNPFGLGQTVTMGIVSATGRADLGIERFENFIQTDAPINPGNSGGALINTRGELIGINTAILAGDTGGNQGIGFAIPADLARNVMDQIIKTGKVEHGYIGITLQSVDQDLEKAFNLNSRHGIAITSVEPNSPGAKAGLQVGDVITEMNGQPVDDLGTFRFHVAGMAPGTVLHLQVMRNGTSHAINVALGTMPAKLLGDNNEENGGNGNAMPGEQGERGALKGLSVRPLTSDLRQQLNLDNTVNGVVVTEVDPDSAAAQAGIQSGDVIQRVNNQPVTSVQEFNRAVRAGNQNRTVVLVNRNGVSQFVVIENK